MRINKFVARAVGTSRRQADDLIERGKILVNGRPASLGTSIKDNDIVTKDGKRLALQQHRYVLLNKPTGYLCSHRSQGGDPTVYEISPGDFRGLQTAGRLDRDSEGLILLTNDGDLSLRLTHPKFGKHKRYRVWTDKPLNNTELDRINKGLVLEDGISRLQIQLEDDHYLIQMQEGRNRQIRRTIEQLGRTVMRLQRIGLGSLDLDDFKKLAEPGSWIDIDSPLVDKLVK